MKKLEEMLNWAGLTPDESKFKLIIKSQKLLICCKHMASSFTFYDRQDFVYHSMYSEFKDVSCQCR